jgi:AbrB family looped-hinge helix DNA binding protein
MSTLKLHYEGWLALPAGFRQKLGLKSGDRLEAELAGGTITLRPAPPATRRAARQPAPATLPPVSKSRGGRKAKETGGRPSGRS